MKKVYLLVLAIFLLMLAGCSSFGDSSQDKKLFTFTKEEVQGSEKLANMYSKDKVSFRYPMDWKKLNNTLPLKLAKDDGSINLNVAIEKSDNYLQSVTDPKEMYLAALKTSDFPNPTFVKIGKEKWKNGQGMYVECRLEFVEMIGYFAQYVYDDGENMVVLTFTSSEADWKNNEATARKILASLEVNK